MRNPWMDIWLTTVGATMRATAAFWISVLQSQIEPQHALGAERGEGHHRRTPAKTRTGAEGQEAARGAGKTTQRSSAADPIHAKKRVAVPKYRHLDDPNLVWSGRGRRPRWVTEALEAGRRLDDLDIAKR